MTTGIFLTREVEEHIPIGQAVHIHNSDLLVVAAADSWWAVVELLVFVHHSKLVVANPTCLCQFSKRPRRFLLVLGS